MSGLVLRTLRAEDETEAVRAHEELAADHFEFLSGWEPGLPWADLLASYAAERRGVDLPPGRVPASFLVAEVDGEIVGRVSIRHELNDWLLRYGGHIGYGVRPAHRRRGYATEILCQSLEVARAVGVEKALLTCDDDNLASAATIERCGGVLEDVVPVEGGKPKRRYWIG
ncbi:GNAT family N-acetyltransferase [Nocardioides pantholopis]|uniref:GNAT family N-acetyltransferase n=1 Tax=Nocardioides pantholopis TaxID=2483798 RepID=UPI000FD92B1B|nr:GNAT family N-acetyltransferase [Nocardioides pantholopis]